MVVVVTTLFLTGWMRKMYNFLAQYYDKFTTNVDYFKIVDFVCNYINKDDIVLDLCCGTGTLTYMLEGKGFNMIGVDFSYEMLSEALSKKDENSGIIFLRQDATSLDLYGTIKGAVCSLDSLNHFGSIEDVSKAVAKISLFMESGGYFIFDINSLYKHKEILQNNNFTYEDEGVFCSWQNYLLEDNSINIVLEIFTNLEKYLYKRDTEEFTEMYIPVEKINDILLENQFELVGFFDNYSENPVVETTERITVVAKKK